eukprot:239028_1
MSTEQNKIQFDTDKYLRLFEEDTGCRISHIASKLQFQSQETKEKNWQTFSKNKDELVTFIEIYTIVMGIVAYTLKSNQISKKPSQNSIKALTSKLFTKLPKSDDNKPILTKSQYMNNLHHLLNEIYDEVQDNMIDKNSSIPTQNTLDKENNLATYFKEQNTNTQETQLKSAYNNNAIVSELKPVVTGKPVGKDLAVGTVVTCVEYTKHGIDYSGSNCTIQMKYNEDFHGYLVQFDTVNLEHIFGCNYEPETYISADKLVLPNETVLEMNSTETPAETTQSFTPKLSKYLPVSTRDNDNYEYRESRLKSMPSVGDCGNYVTDTWDRIPNTFKKNCCCRMICMIILIVICSFLIDYGIELKRDGKEYTAVATQETCSIIGFDRQGCIFDCDCDTYKEKYSEIVYKCEYNRKKREDDCYSDEYIYKTTAGAKCGNTELIMNEYDALGTCKDSPYDVGKELDCYVLNCEDEEFTMTHPDTLTGVGETKITIGAIVLVVGVVLCCLFLITLICIVKKHL